MFYGPSTINISACRTRNYAIANALESTRLVIMSQLKEMDELLRCSVCTERYNTDTRKPKILLCHHTFCLKCLKGWAAKQANSKNGINISCPSCRKVTNVGKKGVSSLQENFYLEHVQSAVNAMDDIFLSDQEETRANTAQDNRRYKIWCQTCKKTASSSCSTDSDHNICNFMRGAGEHLQNLRQNVTEKLLAEINCWETVVSFFESGGGMGNGIKKSLVGVAEEVCGRTSDERKVNETLWWSYRVKEAFKMSFRDRNEETEEEYREKKRKVKHMSSMSVLNSVDASGQIQEDLNSYQLALTVARSELDSMLELHTLSNKDPPALLDDTIDDIDDSVAPPFMDENKTSLGQAENSWHHVESRKGRSTYSESNGIQLFNLVAKPPISSNSNTSNGSLEPMPGTSGLHKTTIIVKELGNKSQCFFDIEADGHFMGKVVIKLRHDIAPKMCANFVALCIGELGFGYKGTRIFKAHPNDHVVGGDIENNDGTGGYSIFNNKGLFLADECSLKDEMGAIRMRGMGTDIKTGNGLVGSQFHIWLGRRDFRIYRRTLVIGQVVQGLNILQEISTFKALRKADGNFVLTTKAIIKNCGTY
uniref:Peptidylprolyl isomerase n=1 Tax=Timema bartmani TaxID=61472 RepID=A0A7R9I399_9NEOP|nr:unnamed protein product [Timema bartmani]